jgi:hypothetical protein
MKRSGFLGFLTAIPAALAGANLFESKRPEVGWAERKAEQVIDTRTLTTSTPMFTAMTTTSFSAFRAYDQLSAELAHSFEPYIEEQMRNAPGLIR